MSTGPAFQLFIHVEEPSMQEAVEILVPPLIKGRCAEWKVINHQSKPTLLKVLPDRMKAYANWYHSNLRVLVLVDRDDDDCRKLKAKLEDMAISAGLETKTRPGRGGRFKVVNRIVVEELESWFLGDVPALAKAFPGVPSSLGKSARFRDPDAVAGGTWEALLRVLQRAGHYSGANQLPKIEVARAVATLMRPEANRSRSFQTFRAGLDALLN